MDNIPQVKLGIVAVSASAWLFSTANDLVIAFRDGILGHLH